MPVASAIGRRLTMAILSRCCSQAAPSGRRGWSSAATGVGGATLVARPHPLLLLGCAAAAPRRWRPPMVSVAAAARGKRGAASAASPQPRLVADEEEEEQEKGGDHSGAPPQQPQQHQKLAWRPVLVIGVDPDVNGAIAAVSAPAYRIPGPAGQTSGSWLALRPDAAGDGAVDGSSSSSSNPGWWTPPGPGTPEDNADEDGTATTTTHPPSPRVAVFDMPALTTHLAPRRKGASSRKRRKVDAEGAARLVQHLLDEHSDHEVRAFVETATVQPLNGSLSVYSSGYGHGVWAGVLAAAGVRRVQAVPVREWKQALGLYGGGGGGGGSSSSSSVPSPAADQEEEADQKEQDDSEEEEGAAAAQRLLLLAACSGPTTAGRLSHNAASAVAKEASRAAAATLWPEHGALFARRRDHGRAEALLIAAWAAGWTQRRATVAVGAAGDGGDGGSSKAKTSTRVWWQQGPLRGSDDAGEARRVPTAAVAGTVRRASSKGRSKKEETGGEGGGAVAPRAAAAR